MPRMIDVFLISEADSTANQITRAFDAMGKSVKSGNMARVALLAMQGRQSEARGNLRSVLQGASPAAVKQITAAVDGIKPVMIGGRVASSAELDKSPQHNEWIQKTFIPWVERVMQGG